MGRLVGWLADCFGWSARSRAFSIQTNGTREVCASMKATQWPLNSMVVSLDVVGPQSQCVVGWIPTTP